MSNYIDIGWFPNAYKQINKQERDPHYIKTVSLSCTSLCMQMYIYIRYLHPVVGFHSPVVLHFAFSYLVKNSLIYFNICIVFNEPQLYYEKCVERENDHSLVDMKL